MDSIDIQTSWNMCNLASTKIGAQKGLNYGEVKIAIYWLNAQKFEKHSLNRS